MLKNAFALVAAALVLAGCASSVQYKAGPAPADPPKVIERVLYESDTGLERIAASAEYFEYAEPPVTERRLVVLRETVQQPVKRIYYRSIARISLYQKRGTWYVVPETKDGRELAAFVPATADDAQLLADALTALKAGASAQ